MPNPNTKVCFTRQQVEYLNKQYPEMVGDADTAPERRAWYAAQRSVVQFIAARVQFSPGE